MNNRDQTLYDMRVTIRNKGVDRWLTGVDLIHNPYLTHAPKNAVLLGLV